MTTQERPSDAPDVVVGQAPPATGAARKSSRWYVPAFDGLRGVLALVVMWVHAGFPATCCGSPSRSSS